MSDNESGFPQPEEKPSTSPEPPRQALPLASRLSRLFAQILDNLIVGLLSVPLVLILGVVNESTMDQVVEAGGFSFGQYMTFLGVHLLVWVVVNSYLLWYFGQTIGKRMMSIAIVDASDRVPAFFKLVGIRYALIQLLGFIPFFGLIDILAIFRQDRRCIHDFMAQTRVVSVPARS